MNKKTKYLFEKSTESYRNEISDYIGQSTDATLNNKLEKIKKELNNVIKFYNTDDINYLLK